jgi:hypothetical protein
MQGTLFAISEYCVVHNIDPSFINSLEDEGLIRITFSNEEKFIEEEQLHELETFTRWHHDLGINIEGIDALHNLLQRLREVQDEISELKLRLRQYEQPGPGTKF